MSSAMPGVGRVTAETGPRHAAILFVVGFLLVVVAVAMIIPMLADLVVGNEDWPAFLASSVVVGFVGVSLVITGRAPSLELSVRQMFALTTLAWVSIALAGALPLYFSALGLGLTDAIFESMSGLTTTGSTVIVGLDAAPAGILLWRSILQWLGGIGIIVMGIAILPFLRVGGMQLFRMESSDRSDKVVPRVSDLAVLLGSFYLFVTVLCFGAYRIAGMSSFDAANHAMTTIATGGYSTSDASLGNWGAGVHWVGTIFMIAGSLPFVRYISIMRGKTGALWADDQVRFHLAILAAAWAIATVYAMAEAGMPWWDALTHAAFNTTSIITTTGYATTDYQLWGSGMIPFFYLLILLGGCTGSTSGGLKTFRTVILWRALGNQIVRLYSPNRVALIRYNRRTIEPDVIGSVMTFVFLFGGSILIIATVLGFLGLDFVTALSSSAQAIANVGPGLGDLVGPAGNFASLGVPAKLVLTAAMLLGRLEFFAVIVLFSRAYWRR